VARCNDDKLIRFSDGPSLTRAVPGLLRVGIGLARIFYFRLAVPSLYICARSFSGMGKDFLCL